MATELEVLKVRLEAMTSKYNKAMEDAAKKTKTSTGKIDKAMLSMILRFASFAAAVALARKVYRTFTDSLRRIDELAKTARFLGVTTQALASFRHLSDLSGVSTGNLTTALTRMTRAVGEASTGAKEYLEPFQRIGVSIQELMRLKPDEQMARIAEGISGLETHTQQGAVAMEIFGRSGLRMLNVLREGEDGFQQAARAAKAYGLAIRPEDAKKVEDLNDAITRLGASFRGLVNTLTIGIAPAMTKFIDRLLLAQAAANAWWKGDEGGSKAALERMKTLADAMKRLQEPAAAAKDPRVQAEKKAQEKITSWAQQGAEQRLAFDRMSDEVRVQTTIGSLAIMAAAWGEHSRTMFEWSKGLAVAEAAMNIAQGITTAWTLPPPWNAIQAGIVAATGAAQIANISAQQFQKGGGGAAPAGGAGAGAGAAAGAGGGEAAAPLDVSVVMQGNMFGPAQVRDLIGMIDDELSDGVRMRSITISG